MDAPVWPQSQELMYAALFKKMASIDRLLMLGKTSKAIQEGDSLLGIVRNQDSRISESFCKQVRHSRTQRVVVVAVVFTIMQYSISHSITTSEVNIQGCRFEANVDGAGRSSLPPFL